MSTLRERIDRHKSTIIDYRRHLHQTPEVGFALHKTAEYVEKQLERIGLESTTGIAQTGIVSLLAGEKSGAREGKTVLIRADMDGLPMTEETGLPWASRNQQTMHACGHDGHMAMVLGAALVLNSMKDQLPGKVKFLFQPAEEGPGGARPMIDAGVLEQPRVDYVLGAHLWPNLPQGTIGVKDGPLMASMSTFDITIQGKGGHGAMPHLCVDPIDASVQLVNALQRITSRQMNPISPTVVTVGSIHGGTTHNIIPDSVQLQGTTRTFDRDIWLDWPRRIEQIVKGVCQATGTSYELQFNPGYPPLCNNLKIARIAKDSASRVVGKEHVVTPELNMGGEDFAFFLEEVEGCFVFIGTGQPGSAPLHNSRFDFAEDVLLTGVEYFCETALQLLQQT